ncbi:MAG: response regulator [Proteobacteria bacterium]|nr:response regulator [Pseudomonadota bacterium]
MTLQNIEILIIDDEPDMCWALKHLLEKNGFLITKAADGREALDLLTSGSFQGVFLDAKLPDIEGLELARQFREKAPQMRIILISGYFYNDDVAVEKALGEGLICGFIGKPFLHEDILKAVKILSPL